MHLSIKEQRFRAIKTLSYANIPPVCCIPMEGRRTALFLLIIKPVAAKSLIISMKFIMDVSISQ